MSASAAEFAANIERAFAVAMRVTLAIADNTGNSACDRVAACDVLVRFIALALGHKSDGNITTVPGVWS